MNLELLNPFSAAEFPELIERAVCNGSAAICKFNTTGTYMACGCTDGRIVVWDFSRRCEAVLLIGHVRPVTSVSWSHDSTHIVSSSLDWLVMLWDVAQGEAIRIVRFDSPVLSADINPCNTFQAVACPMMEAPVLLDLKKGQSFPLPSEILEDEENGGVKAVHRQDLKTPCNICATFDKRNNCIYVGNNNGYVIVIDAETKTMKSVLCVKQGTALKGIEWSQDYQYFVVNAYDKVLRVFENIGSFSQEQLDKLQPNSECLNKVNKDPWKRGRLSCNGDYVIGAPMAERAEHKIYIFDRTVGQLVKILEGPQEAILDLCWHPLRPIIVSCSSSGVVYVWTQQFNENWSAFDPNFQELEENTTYHEREDEFDVEKNAKKAHNIEEEAEDVDILTDQYQHGEEEDKLRIPVVPMRDPDTVFLNSLLDE